MKYLYILVATFLLTSSAYAQKTGWKEMDTFHDLSSKTLHPAIAGDLTLIKKYSNELLKDATQWQSSTAPKGSDTPQFKADLDKLVKECTDLDDAVKNHKPDDDLKSLADVTHKTFHALLAEAVINH